MEVTGQEGNTAEPLRGEVLLTTENCICTCSGRSDHTSDGPGRAPWRLELAQEITRPTVHGLIRSPNSEVNIDVRLQLMRGDSSMLVSQISRQRWPQDE